MPNDLFGKNIPPLCKYCESALQLLASGKEVLCEKRGIVGAEYHCRRYVYDPLRRIPKRPPPMQEYSPEDFSID